MLSVLHNQRWKVVLKILSLKIPTAGTPLPPHDAFQCPSNQSTGRCLHCCSWRKNTRRGHDVTGVKQSWPLTLPAWPDARHPHTSTFCLHAGLLCLWLRPQRRGWQRNVSSVRQNNICGETLYSRRENWAWKRATQKNTNDSLVKISRKSSVIHLPWL